MVIKEKIGNLSSTDREGRTIDYVSLGWWECNKRILHKRTGRGKEIVLKFMTGAQHLTEGDVLYWDQADMIVVAIEPCEAIVFKPTCMQEMALVCYEIGNKHLPLYYEEETLMIPYDAPTFKLLIKAGLEPAIQTVKLLNPLRTTVEPHAHAGSESLFSKLIKMTGASNV